MGPPLCNEFEPAVGGCRLRVSVTVCFGLAERQEKEKEERAEQEVGPKCFCCVAIKSVRDFWGPQERERECVCVLHTQRRNLSQLKRTVCNCVPSAASVEQQKCTLAGGRPSL